MSAATNRQLAVLKFIKNFVAENGYPPTRKEIASGMGFASPNAAQEHLNALHKKRLISVAVGLSRGIKVLA